MRSISAAIPAPFVVFGVATFAFVAWLAFDATHAPATARHADEESPPVVMPEDPLRTLIETRLASLQPGQPRLVVEQQIAGLALPEVDPIDLSSGKPVCRLRYTIQLVAPIPNLMPTTSNEFRPGPYLITLEFDGSKPGHPLTRVAVAPALKPQDVPPAAASPRRRPLLPPPAH